VSKVSSAQTLDRVPADSSVATKIQTWVLPSLADWVFVAVLVWLFAAASGAQALLADGDAGWHILTGEYALVNGALPPTDPFSFPMEGVVWFAWEWLADIALAVAHRIDGLQGVVLLGGAIIATTAAMTFRYMLWRGVNLFLALGALMLICGVSTMHWLARPHMFTWGFLLATLWLLEADRQKNRRAVWLLVPLAVIWTNTHGGFVALLICVGVFGAGLAAEQLIAGQTDFKNIRIFWPPAAKRYGLLLGACLAATLLNPYGYGLHTHIVDYMGSSFILEHVEEFQSPRFRTEAMTMLEVTLMASLVAIGFMLRRGEIAWPLLMLAWAHASLTSVRHAPLFMAVAAPVVALEATRLFESAAKGGHWVLKTIKEVADDYSKPGAQPSESNPLPLGWVCVASLIGVAVLMNTHGDQEKYKAEFPAAKFPAKAADALGDRLPTQRVLTTDQWGDYLIYRFHPEFKTFIDGRSDFYDPEVRDDYLALMGTKWNWESILDKYEFDSALLPLEWSLSSAMKQHSGWRLVYDDGQSVYFERRADAKDSALRAQGAGAPLIGEITLAAAR